MSIDHRSSNKDRLSSFGQRLQTLSESFYSTILEDSKDENKVQIKNAKDLEQCQRNDFTFDQCSTSQMTSNDDFSFTFHSIEQSESQKCQTKRINHSSTPYSIREEHFLAKKNEDETILVDENRHPMIIGYYPVISYQPVCLPPPIYLSKEQIQSSQSRKKL